MSNSTNHSQNWQPHITVAAAIQNHAGKFLLVEEHSESAICFNQPAGHWEYGESLTEAVIREVLEETGYIFTPDYLLGIYQWTTPKHDKTYLRFAFAGRVADEPSSLQLDPIIIACHWLSLAELNKKNLRSPLVLSVINDFLSGTKYPLELCQNLDFNTTGISPE